MMTKLEKILWIKVYSAWLMQNRHQAEREASLAVEKFREAVKSLNATKFLKEGSAKKG